MTRPSVHLLLATIRQGARRPRFVAEAAFWRQLRYGVHPAISTGQWDDNGSLRTRRYSDYQRYVTHQRSKLALLDLANYQEKLRADLSRRLKGGEWSGARVVCLAARLGAEVRAFHDVGAFAVGIDLNPGPGNPYVLTGDFHDLVFPDHCVDAVYCNSLDHALDLHRLLAEVRRILKPGGRLMVDAQMGSGSAEFDHWSATAWRTIDDLVDAIAAEGFDVVGRRPIRIPLAGEQIDMLCRATPLRSQPVVASQPGA